MVLVAAAACPCPPLLVPALASGAAAELDELRACCAAAVAALDDARPDVLYVVAADGGPRARSLAPWGVAVAVDVPEPVPLGLLVGGWLTAGRVRSFVAVDPGDDAGACAALGAELAGSAGRVALLAMGDGSARRTERAPGYLDPRAEAYDAELVRALAAADTAALLALDPATAAALMVSGRAPWQVLAGAAAGDGRWRGQLLYAGAPYGVGYPVASWTPA